jgi:hypothetical protein
MYSGLILVCVPWGGRGDCLEFKLDPPVPTLQICEHKLNEFQQAFMAQEREGERLSFPRRECFKLETGM